MQMSMPILPGKTVRKVCFECSGGGEGDLRDWAAKKKKKKVRAELNMLIFAKCAENKQNRIIHYNSRIIPTDLICTKTFRNWLFSHKLGKCRHLRSSVQCWVHTAWSTWEMPFPCGGCGGCEGGCEAKKCFCSFCDTPTIVLSLGILPALNRLPPLPQPWILFVSPVLPACGS